MRIVIPRGVYQKIKFWVDYKDQEVSGFGKVLWHEEAKELHISNVVLLKQEVGAAHTDIEPASLAKADYDMRNVEGDFHFWWHSHVKMNAFWSGQDIATIKELGGNGYCVAAVFNQHGAMRGAVSFQAQTPFGLVTEIKEDVPIVIVDEGIDTTELQKQYDDLVTAKTYKYQRGYSAWDDTANDWSYQGPPLLAQSEKKTKKKKQKSVHSSIQWVRSKVNKAIEKGGFSPGDDEYDRSYRLDTTLGEDDAFAKEAWVLGLTSDEYEDFVKSASREELAKIDALLAKDVYSGT